MKRQLSSRRRLGKIELAIALSFNIQPDEAKVSRTISMIPPDRREEWVIRQARERPTAERAAFLDGACAGDEALRQRLEARLAARDQPETPPASQADTPLHQLKGDRDWIVMKCLEKDRARRYEHWMNEEPNENITQHR